MTRCSPTVQLGWPPVERCSKILNQKLCFILIQNGKANPRMTEQNWKCRLTIENQNLVEYSRKLFISEQFSIETFDSKLLIQNLWERSPFMNEFLWKRFFSQAEPFQLESFKRPTHSYDSQIAVAVLWQHHDPLRAFSICVLLPSRAPFECLQMSSPEIQWFFSIRITRSCWVATGKILPKSDPIKKPQFWPNLMLINIDPYKAPDPHRSTVRNS